MTKLFSLTNSKYFRVIILLVTFLKIIFSLQYPLCDDQGNVCHLADGRRCDGYKILNNENLESLDLIWMEQNQKKIVIVKNEVTFEKSIEICNAICGKLYEPQDYNENYYGFSNTCNENGLKYVFVGIIGQKTDSEKNYYYLSNESFVLPLKNSDFIDVYFDSAVNMQSPGDYPLLMFTQYYGSQRFNHLAMSNYEEEHAFACESNFTTSNENPEEKSKYSTCHIFTKNFKRYL